MRLTENKMIALCFLLMITAISFMVFELIEKRSNPVPIPRSQIISDLLYQKCYENNQIWTNQQHDIAVDALCKNETLTGIDSQIVMCIMQIESEYKIDAVGYNDGKCISIDVGLCQINSINLSLLYGKAEKVCIENNMKYESDDIFDISLNITACFIYLSDSKKALLKNNEYSFQRWIQSYNVGLQGSSDSPRYKHLQKKKSEYYVKFLEL